MTNTRPCQRSSLSFLPIKNAKKRKIVVPIHIQISAKLHVLILMGANTDEIPRIQKILKIFEPTILPTAISFCPFRAATIDVISSGIDVPMATIVRPITRSETPNNCAILTAPSTNIFHPTMSPTRPSTMSPIEIQVLYFLIPESVFSSSLLMPAI